MTPIEKTFEALKFPVVIDEYGTRRWHNADGKLHRADGPAVIYTSGLKWFYTDGKFDKTRNV